LCLYVVFSIYKKLRAFCKLLLEIGITFFWTRESTRGNTGSPIESAVSKAPLAGFREEVPMMYLRFLLLRSLSCRCIAYSHKLIFILLLAFVASPCIAQEQPAEAASRSTLDRPDDKVTIPAGTRFALVLTHPIQSRYLHRGDDIYAQINSPVDAGNQMVIPPGTFVQGAVERLEQRKGRAFLHLQSMSITFSDGYVAPVSGPVTLDSNEGYAIKDPGGRRMTSALLLPAAGAGVGALIGHSVGASSQTFTNSLPPGCVGPPPGCLTSSMTVPGNTGMHTAIGAGVGAAAGIIASMGVMFSSRHFYMDAGSPVEMTLERPITLSRDEVAKAVEHATGHALETQPVMPRPEPPPSPPPSPPLHHGTFHTPGTPGTPPTVIPGTPGPNGVPGPPTIIPGTPPIPGTPYPCP
jgi:hypothetical protein